MSMLTSKHYDLIPYFQPNGYHEGVWRHGNRGVSAQFQPPTYAAGGHVEGVIVERQVVYWAYKPTPWFSGESLKVLSSTVTGLCVGGGWNGAHVGLPSHVAFDDMWMGDQPWRAEVRCFATFIPCKKDPFSPGTIEAPSQILERLGLQASSDTFPTYGLEESVDVNTGGISPLNFDRDDIRWHEPWNPAQPRWDLVRTFKFEQNYNSVCDISVSVVPITTHTHYPSHMRTPTRTYTYARTCTHAHQFVSIFVTHRKRYTWLTSIATAMAGLPEGLRGKLYAFSTGRKRIS